MQDRCCGWRRTREGREGRRSPVDSVKDSESDGSTFNKANDFGSLDDVIGFFAPKRFEHVG